MKRHEYLKALRTVSGALRVGARRGLSTAVVACTPLAILAPLGAEAQVVLSGGVTETYDDNIFLEKGNGLPPVILQDSQAGDPSLVLSAPTEADGKKNDDFLTDVHVGASGAPLLFRGVKSSMGATVGGIFFADQSDYDRATLNADLDLRSQKELIPEPFFVGVGTQIRSQSNNASVGQGTATRLSEVLYSNLDLGVRSVRVARDTTWGAGYRFGYVNYLGDFTFKSNPNDNLGPLGDRFRNQGSDYITNTVSTAFDEQISKRFSATLGVALTDFVVTDANSSGVVNSTSNDLDRDELTPSLTGRYIISKDFTADGSVGYNMTRYQNDRSSVQAVVINPDGTQTVINEGRSNNSDSFIFTAGTSYSPDPGTALRLGVDQTTTPDVNGERLITRGVTFSGVETLTDRLRGSLSARYLQYGVGSNLTNPTDRWEFTAALQYSITPSVSLNTGYQFADQSIEKNNLEQRAIFTTEDYQSNRIFLGLSAGFVGLEN